MSWALTQLLGWVGWMPIPEFEESGLLPLGDHEATLAEIRDRFCWNYRRKEIYSGLEYVTDELISHDVKNIWVDGSFTTSQERPGDVDVAYEIPVDSDPWEWGWLSPARRRDLKKIRRVDLLPDEPGTSTFHDYFSQVNGTLKGIIRLMTDAA